MSFSVSKEVAGRTLTIETGSLAGQADGAVTVVYGDTVVLVTACHSAEPRPGASFLPLTVDYEERLYAAGKIPGGFIKREGRPTQEATLAMRLTDRATRPLFPQEFRHEIQVIITVLSVDQENDPDILAIIGASAALSLSSIPFGGPVAATRIGYRQGEFLVNPTFTQLQESDLDLVVAGTREAVLMLEAGARQVSEEVVLEAIRRAQQINQALVELQEGLLPVGGKPKTEVKRDEALAAARATLDPLLAKHLEGHHLLEEKTLRQEALDVLGEKFPAQALADSLEEVMKKVWREHILKRGFRPDGRGLSEVRPIAARVGTLPRTHGSGLFTRGQTQVLTIATLGSIKEEQRLDGLSPEESKRFMHHYNFPPFSVGETRRTGIPTRREIGHGALAERALAPVIPSEGEFPYTIRLVSEVLSSNGSTSMASACGSTLSLMDAGVPIKAPVAGVAMGLVMGQDGKHALLTDIEGKEDALGDMDFKVAGTAQGITALQLDLKLQGIPLNILGEALAGAREARLSILKKMDGAISSSRPEISRYAPRMYKIKIDPEKIRLVIGPGGRVIRSLEDETKVTIDIENDGTIIIGSSNEEMARKTIEKIEALTREAKVGEIYTGRVTRVVDFGAFVEILPGKEGLVRLAELADPPPPSVADVVKIGDEIKVMVIEIDHQGRINLSHRALSQAPGQASPPSGPHFRPRPTRTFSGPSGGRPAGRPFPGRRPSHPPPNP